MNFKLVSYWVLSIITLICCLSLSFTNNNSQISPLNLTNKLDVEPKYFYYSNNKYHAKISEELILEIKTDAINADTLLYNRLIINELDLDLNATISLNWEADNQSHKVLLNHTRTSITPINFNVNSFDKINKLYISIKPNFDLGRRLVFEREASFQSIVLDSANNQSTATTLISEWFDFNPISFTAINGYSDTNKMNVKGLIFRLIIWLTTTIIFFKLLGVTGVQMIATLSIAWLLTVIVYANNFNSQHQQILQAYSKNYPYLNSQDKDAFTVAESIRSTLHKNPEWYKSNSKIIIVGFQDFNNLRLLHHLMDLNIGIISNTNIQTNNYNDHDNLIYIMAFKNHRHCSNPKYFNFIDFEVEIIGTDSMACLVRIK